MASLLKYFDDGYLPAHRQKEVFGELARLMIDVVGELMIDVIGDVARRMDAELPGSPEKSAALRDLLEAKDRMVRDRAVEKPVRTLAII